MSGTAESVLWPRSCNPSQSLQGLQADTNPFYYFGIFVRRMESNIADQQFGSPDSPLAEPHFDEEVTLLSARPVVPIERLTRKPVSTRPWVFGFALAGALLLGASATALYYSQFRSTGSQAFPNSEKVSAGAQGAATETAARDQPPIDATDTTGSTVGGSSSVDSDTSARVRVQSPTVLWTTRTLNPSNTASKKSPHLRATEVINQSSEPEYETHERRGAKREAKERKRANRAGRDHRSSDELFRIREIFEGPQRP